MSEGQQFRQDRRPPEWKEEGVHKDEATGLQFITQTLGDRLPVWGCRLGFTNKDGKLTSWGRPQVKYNPDGTVTLVSPIRQMIDFLTRIEKEVDLEITTKAEAYNEAHLAAKRAREQRQISWGKKETKHTGKTARKREKERNGHNQST